MYSYVLDMGATKQVTTARWPATAGGRTILGSPRAQAEAPCPSRGANLPGGEVGHSSWAPHWSNASTRVGRCRGGIPTAMAAYSFFEINALFYTLPSLWQCHPKSRHKFSLNQSIEIHNIISRHSSNDAEYG